VCNSSDEGDNSDDGGEYPPKTKSSADYELSMAQIFTSIANPGEKNDDDNIAAR
jgi:hypothetical protein